MSHTSPRSCPGARLLRRALVVLTSLALLAGLSLLGTPSAQAGPPADPRPGVSTAAGARAAADPTLPPPPRDAVGRPAAYTVAPADDLLVDKTAPDASRSVRGWMQSREDMSDMRTRGPDGTETSRPLVKPVVATASGRPLDADRDRTFSLRLKRAGSNNLWQVGTDDDVAEDWTEGAASDATPVSGHTYVMSLASTGRAVAIPPASTDFGTEPLTLVPADAAAPRQQWSVVAMTERSGWFKVVNRSDGQCLNVWGGLAGENASIRTYYCDREHVGEPASIAWRAVPDPGSPHRFRLQSAVSDLVLTRLGNDFVQSTTSAARADDQLFAFQDLYPRAEVVPTWSYPTSNEASEQGDLAVGDLDQSIADDGRFRDEAAVAMTAGADHHLVVRVLDYNAGDGHLLEAMPKNMPTIVPGKSGGGSWQPGSVGVAIGDFDGDLSNDLAVTWQDESGAFKVMFLSYDEGNLTIRQTARTVVPVTAQVQPSLLGGLADLAVGDFDGDSSDDLAITFGSGSSVSTLKPWLASVSFDADLDADAYGATQVDDLADEGTTPHLLVPPSGQPWTARGLRLAAGRFTDSRDYDIHRRQLVVGYTWAAGIGSSAHGTNLRLLDVSRDGWQPSSGGDPTSSKLDVTAKADPVGVTEGASGSLEARNSPMSMVAGGFGGIGGDDQLPLTGVAVYSWQESLSGSVPNLFVYKMSGGQLVWAHSEHIVDDPSWHVSLTNYDRQGRSVRLGAPVVLRVPAFLKLTALAAQPPAHVDWLPGNDSGTNGADSDSPWVKVSRTGGFNVTMGDETSRAYTSSLALSASSEIAVSQEFDSKTTVKAGLFGIANVGGSLTVQQKFGKSWASSVKALSKYTTTVTNDDISTTGDDDILRGVKVTLTTYRYPIIGAQAVSKDGSPLKTPECTPCHPFYEVTLPGDPIKVHTDGSAVTGYQPRWQNGNALSYPRLVNGEVPIDDQGSYSFAKAGNAPTTRSAPMFNTDYTVGASKSGYTLTMASDAGADVTRTSGGGLTNSAELKVGVNAKFDVGVAKVKEEGSVSAGVDVKSTWATDVGQSTETASANTFKVSVPPIVKTLAYDVGTTYYTDASGLPKVVHGVDLDSDDLGSKWWKRTYGQKPDLALNLPYATIMTKDDLDHFTVPKWNNGLERQQIRGFWALQPASPDSPVTSGVPYASAPVAGDPVVFSVNVYNYSLTTSPASTATFYAVPVDPSKEGVTGQAVRIGQAGVKAMGPQGMVSVKSPQWTAVGPQGGAGLQNYRIVVVLDADDSVGEIHEWKGGAGCPTTELLDTHQQLIDPMTGTLDHLSCAQNNQGYGEVTVMAHAPTSGAPATLALEEGSLGGGLLGDHDGVTTVVRGQRLHGTVDAASTARTGDFADVAVYDGPASAGDLVALTKMQGADTAHGGTARYTWTPQDPGRHVLTTVLTSTDGSTSTRTRTVDVLAHGPATSLSLTPAHATTNPGQPVAYRARVVDDQHNVVADVSAQTTFTASRGALCVVARCSATTPGPYPVTARNDGRTATATFTVAGPVAATKLTATSGGGQKVRPGATFPEPLVAHATTADAAAAGAQVRFSVTSGPARFTGGTSTVVVAADQSGDARSPALVATDRAGRVVVTATSGRASATFVNQVERPRRDIAVTISAPPTVRPGHRFTATVTVTNLGTERSHRGRLVLRSTEGVRIKDAHGWHTTANHRRATHKLRAIAASRSKTFRVVCRAGKPSTASLRVRAAAGHESGDGNNTDVTTVIIR